MIIDVVQTTANRPDIDFTIVHGLKEVGTMHYDARTDTMHMQLLGEELCVMPQADGCGSCEFDDIYNAEFHQRNQHFKISRGHKRGLRQTADTICMDTLPGPVCMYAVLPDRKMRSPIYKGKRLIAQMNDLRGTSEPGVEFKHYRIFAEDYDSTLYALLICAYYWIAERNLGKTPVTADRYYLGKYDPCFAQDVMP